MWRPGRIVLVVVAMEVDRNGDSRREPAECRSVRGNLSRSSD
jgi:hypothetical protein